MMQRHEPMQLVALRRCRILFTWSVCLLLAFPAGYRGKAIAQYATPLQRQQEMQREQQQQRQQQEQREEQQRQREEQQQQREEQQRAQQEQREQQQREQQRQQQEQQQQQQREEQQQRQQQAQQQQREQQQREDQQREQQQRGEQQRAQQLREGQQRQQQRPSDPVLQRRPVNPEPIWPRPRPEPGRSPVLPDRPVHGPEPRPIVPDRPVHGPERPPILADRPVHGPEPRPVLPLHPFEPHPVREPRPVVSGEPLRVQPLRPLPVRPDPDRRLPRPIEVIPVRPRPVVVVHAPSTASILALGHGPRVVVVAGGGSSTAVIASPQQYAQAQANLQSAQDGCAQADAYQNYVTSLVNSQNTVDQGVQQILQTVADNTTDPNLQDALESAANQPNPISDALHQQLQNLASTYEQTCQTHLAAAQAAMPPDPSQQADAGFAPSQDAPGDQASNPSQLPPAASNLQSAPNADALGSASSGAAQTGACAPVSATNLPQPKSPWGAWVPLGNSGLVFDVSRANTATLTWRFLNAGTNTISAMNFNYSYVDADSGQPATQSDVLPFALAPGQSVGGWAAYTANTRGNISLAITQISCQ